MGLQKYQQVSDERYQIIKDRYKQFVECLHDPSKEPVRVFDPLSEKHIQEIQLIREVSKDLQAKKEEDIAKAAQAAKQAEEEAAQREAEKKEENAEEKKDDAENKDEAPKVSET